MDDKIKTSLLETLEDGQIHHFRKWSSTIVPKICAGVYTIWKDEQLIYVGMSGRSMSSEIIAEHRNSGLKAKGMFTRLKSHSSGRRNGDQFCIYVGDRLVLPLLSNEQIQAIVKGQLSFDKLIKDYIHTNLTYRFVETENDKLAYQLENAIKNGILKAGKPFLNPS